MDRRNTKLACNGMHFVRAVFAAMVSQELQLARSSSDIADAGLDRLELHLANGLAKPAMPDLGVLRNKLAFTQPHVKAPVKKLAFFARDFGTVDAPSRVRLRYRAHANAGTITDTLLRRFRLH